MSHPIASLLRPAREKAAWPEDAVRGRCGGEREKSRRRRDRLGGSHLVQRDDISLAGGLFCSIFVHSSRRTRHVRISGSRSAAGPHAEAAGQGATGPADAIARQIRRSALISLNPRPGNSCRLDPRPDAGRLCEQIRALIARSPKGDVAIEGPLLAMSAGVTPSSRAATSGGPLARKSRRKPLESFNSRPDA